MPGIPSSFNFANLEPSHISESPIMKEKRISGFISRWVILFSFSLLIGLGIFYIFLNKSTSSTVLHFSYMKGPSPDFIGRKKYLDVLYNDLISSRHPKNSHEPVKFKVLWGKGGYGKSELAIEFANRFQSYFSLIWTFYCDSQEHIDQGYRGLAENLGLMDSEESIEKIKEKVHFYLENHSFRQPWLLVFDNVEKELTDYPQRGGSILVTSQKRVLNPEFILEIQPFSKEEALELFEKVTQEKPSLMMEQLAQDLEGIPLLINYAAHYIKATPNCTIADYQKIFSTHLHEKVGPLWREADVNRRYFKSLAASWEFPLRSLEKENPEALQWLFICSYLYPEKIPEEWMGDWLQNAHESFKDPSTLEIKKKQMLQVLQTYGVIGYDKKTRTLSLHRFFQHLIRESRKDHLEEDVARAISVLANHSSDFKFSEFSSWKQGEAWFLHAGEMGKWLHAYHPKFANPSTKIKAALFYEGIVNYCLFNDRYLDALEANYQVLDFKKAIYGEKSLEIGKVYQSIGWTLLKLARFEEGLRACHNAEEIQRNLTGQLALDYALTLTTKGRIVYAQGDYEKALNCHTQALQIRLDNLGEFHVEVGRSLFNIIRCFNKMGRNEEVLSIHKRVKKIYTKTCGRNHPYYAWSLEIKGRAAHDLGRYKKALKIFNEALSILRITRGINHGELAVSLDGIGWCHYHLEEYKAAKNAFKQASKLGACYGEGTVVSVRTYRSLGWTYLKLGKIEKATYYLLKWIEDCSKIYKNAPKMESSLKDFHQALVDCSKKVGKASYLVDAASEAFKISKETLGEGHPLTDLFQKFNGELY